MNQLYFGGFRKSLGHQQTSFGSFGSFDPPKSFSESVRGLWTLIPGGQAGN